MDESAPALLGKADLDRLVVARLIEAPPDDYPQAPLQYIMRCYARAADEARGKHVAASPALQATVQLCRELAINYAGLTLAGGIVPHVGPVVSERCPPAPPLPSLRNRLGTTCGADSPFHAPRAHRAPPRPTHVASTHPRVPAAALGRPNPNPCTAGGGGGAPGRAAAAGRAGRPAGLAGGAAGVAAAAAGLPGGPGGQAGGGRQRRGAAAARGARG